MIKHIKALFEQFQQEITQENTMDFQTALAALLVEVMRADGEFKQSELEKIETLLAKYCDLDTTQVQSVITQAKEHVEHALDLHSFVSIVNQHSSDVARIDIIELLWLVAFADGELDGEEEHIIRKISSLMYVTHADFIQAKIAAKEALQL